MIVGDMERKHNINLLLLSVLLLMTAACSTTRNLPEDETLYVGVKNMEILNEDKTPAGVQMESQGRFAKTFERRCVKCQTLHGQNRNWPTRQSV